jgi:hypothetical protein
MVLRINTFCPSPKPFSLPLTEETVSRFENAVRGQDLRAALGYLETFITFIPDSGVSVGSGIPPVPPKWDSLLVESESFSSYRLWLILRAVSVFPSLFLHPHSVAYHRSGSHTGSSTAFDQAPKPRSLDISSVSDGYQDLAFSSHLVPDLLADGLVEFSAQGMQHALWHVLCRASRFFYSARPKPIRRNGR